MLEAAGHDVIVTRHYYPTPPHPTPDKAWRRGKKTKNAQKYQVVCQHASWNYAWGADLSKLPKQEQHTAVLLNPWRGRDTCGMLRSKLDLKSRKDLGRFQMVDWAPNDEQMSPESTKSRANHPQHNIVWDTETPLGASMTCLGIALNPPKKSHGSPKWLFRSGRHLQTQFYPNLVLDFWGNLTLCHSISLSLVFFGDFSAGKVSRSQLRMVGASGGFSPISAARSCVVSAAQSRAAVTHGMSKDSDEERMSFTTRWLGSDEDRWSRTNRIWAQGPLWCLWETRAGTLDVLNFAKRRELLRAAVRWRTCKKCRRCLDLKVLNAT